MKLPRSAPKILGVPVSIETAKGLAKASRDIFLKRYAPDEIQLKRKSICMDCPSWVEASNRCTECGCQMRVKISLASSSCPLKKWDSYAALSDLGDAAIDTTEHQE
tara:strand:+ start:1899 stop:2216 length:318 start_codon:yes stop_codon:yes gene_type:complete